jgi:alkanesulfonate monooxygenase SsuD/methylene tetrahydromethanopterin reductase-like flavin-dependent oxidoreductase (luciferase family)
MKCGVTFHHTNFGDWERFLAKDWDREPDVPDHVLWERAIKHAEMVDELGFDMIWTTEHRSTPYGIIPNPLTFVAFCAGRTKNVGFGTMAIIIPWWNPMRAAEEVALIDNLVGDRRWIVGFGRGVAEYEFNALGIDRNESRGRFKEGIAFVKRALTEEGFSFDGEFFSVSEASVRPRPRHSDLVDNMFGVFTSAESMQVVAEAGLGIGVTAGIPMDRLIAWVPMVNGIRAGMGLPPTQPMMSLFCYPTETQKGKAAGEEYLRRLEADINLNYRYADPAAFEGVKGYEQYVEEAKKRRAGAEPNKFHLVGTPDEIIEKLSAIQEQTSVKEYMFDFFLPQISQEELDANVQLFAREVLPAVKEMEPTLHEHSLAPAGSATSEAARAPALGADA